MNVRTMKAIDQYLGVPVCLFLDMIHRVRLPLCRRSSQPLRRILVMKFFGIGSILLASPMLRGIKHRYPEASIGFLTFAGNREIVERVGIADTVHTLRTDSPVRFAIDLFHVLKEVRQQGYDAAIDMEFFSKFSTIVTYLSGSPVRIGFFLRQMWRGNLLTEQVYYNHYKHVTEVFAALAVPLGVTVPEYLLQPPVLTEADKAKTDVLLTREGIRPDELLIGFNVNSSDLSLERRWPREEFLVLARGLLEELEVRLIFFGSPTEAAYVAEMAVELPDDGRVINVAGKTGLAELLGLLKRCGLVVSNDSGPLHLAASLGVRTVSFFGPESPMLYGPKGGDALVFYEGIYCSPCLNVFNVKTAPCNGRNMCMQRIKADAVLCAMRERFKDLWEQYPNAA